MYQVLLRARRMIISMIYSIMNNFRLSVRQIGKPVNNIK